MGQNDFTKGQIRSLSSLNRLALIGLAPMRKGTPTAGLEVIFNVQPLHLQIRVRGLASFFRNKMPPFWDGVGNSGYRGHIYKWDKLSKNLEIASREIDDVVFYQNWTPPISKKFDKRADLQCLLVHVDLDGRTYMNYIISLRGEWQSIGSLILGGPEGQHRLLRGIGDVIQEVLSYSKSGYKVMLVGDFFPSRILNYFVQCPKTARIINLLHMVWQKTGVRVLMCNHSQARTRQSRLLKLKTARCHGPAVTTSLSRAGLKLSIHNWSMRVWGREWSSSESCRQSKLWFPVLSIDKSRIIRQLSRQELGLFVQFITGHNFLRRHQNLVTLRGEVVCRLCGGDVEDSEHLFSSCLGLRKERLDILKTLRLPNPFMWEPTQLGRFLRIPTIALLMRSPGEE